MGFFQGVFYKKCLKTKRVTSFPNTPVDWIKSPLPKRWNPPAKTFFELLLRGSSGGIGSLHTKNPMTEGFGKFGELMLDWIDGFDCSIVPSRATDIKWAKVLEGEQRSGVLFLEDACANFEGLHSPTIREFQLFR